MNPAGRWELRNTYERVNAHLDETDEEDVDAGCAIFALRDARTLKSLFPAPPPAASPLFLAEERNCPSEVMVSCSAMSSTSVSASSSLSADAAEATEAKVL